MSFWEGFAKAVDQSSQRAYEASTRKEQREAERQRFLFELKANTENQLAMARIARKDQQDLARLQHSLGLQTLDRQHGYSLDTLETQHKYSLETISHQGATNASTQKDVAGFNFDNQLELFNLQNNVNKTAAESERQHQLEMQANDAGFAVDRLRLTFDNQMTLAEFNAENTRFLSNLDREQKAEFFELTRKDNKTEADLQREHELTKIALGADLNLRNTTETIKLSFANDMSLAEFKAANTKELAGLDRKQTKELFDIKRKDNKTEADLQREHELTMLGKRFEHDKEMQNTAFTQGVAKKAIEGVSGGGAKKPSAMSSDVALQRLNRDFGISPEVLKEIYSANPSALSEFYSVLNDKWKQYAEEYGVGDQEGFKKNVIGPMLEDVVISKGEGLDPNILSILDEAFDGNIPELYLQEGASEVSFPDVQIQSRPDVAELNSARKIIREDLMDKLNEEIQAASSALADVQSGEITATAEQKKALISRMQRLKEAEKQASGDNPSIVLLRELFPQDYDAIIKDQFPQFKDITLFNE